MMSISVRVKVEHLTETYKGAADLDPVGCEHQSHVMRIYIYINTYCPLSKKFAQHSTVSMHGEYTHDVELSLSGPRLPSV